MIAIYIVMALLIAAGLFCLFNIRITEVFRNVFMPFEKREERRRRIDRLTDKQPRRLRGMVKSAAESLSAMGMTERWEIYKICAVLLAILGIIIGFAIDNVWAAVVLAPTLALLPFVAIRLQTATASKRIMTGLSTNLGVITNHYIQNADILSSAKSQLNTLQQPLKSIFAEFVYTVEYINPDVQAAVLAMRGKIRNRYWQQWCDDLARCQVDNGLRITLSSIVKDLAESYRMQEELNTAVNSIFANFFMELAVLIGTPLLISMVYPDYANVLMFTDAGKIIVAVVLLVILLCLIQMAKINRPLEEE